MILEIMPKFTSKEDFCKQSNVRSEINKELVQFAYDNLDNLPLAKGDANYERMISGMMYVYHNYLP